MERASRTELLDRYYAAVDEEAFDRFERAFTDDVEYRYPGEEPMRGIDEVRTFFEERREHSNSTHEVHRRVDDETVTVCEGTVTAARADGTTFDLDFVGVFEFDEAAALIDRVGVYVRR